MQNPYNTVNTYSPRGVNFPDGVRVGNFQLPGSQSTSRGISVVEPVVWSVKPFQEQDIITQTFATPGTYKIDLANSSLYPSESVYIWSGNQMVLDCERVIDVSSEQDFYVKVSGLTQYNQKVVCEGNPIAGEEFNVFETARGYRALTDVTVVITTPNTTIVIATTNKLVLPFNQDFPAFLNARYVYEADGSLVYLTLFKCGTATQAPYPLVPNFNLIGQVANKEDMLPNSGTPRPILDLFNNTDNYPVQFNDNAYLTIEFLLDSAGFNPNKSYETSNNLELTIGIEPYSVGWEG